MATPAWMNRERVVRGALIVAAPILAILIAASIEEWSLSDLVTPTPSPAVALHQAQGAMDTVVKQFDAYVTDYSELPENLVEIGVPAPGDWTYTKRPGNEYQLVLKMYGQVITFESSRRSGS